MKNGHPIYPPDAILRVSRGNYQESHPVDAAILANLTEPEREKARKAKARRLKRKKPAAK